LVVSIKWNGNATTAAAGLPSAAGELVMPRSSTLRRVLDATIEEALSFGEESS